MTQADIDAGADLVNTATVTGTPPGGGEVTPPPGTTTTSVEAAPSLTIEKVGTLVPGDDGVANVGDTISYTFTVTNTGNVTLTDVTVVDALVGVTVTGGPIASLDPGVSDTTTFTATYAVTQADINTGEVVNTATAWGTPAGGGDPVPSPPDEVTTELPAVPGISIEKTVAAIEDVNGNDINDAGDIIRWSFRVENTGNVTLTGVTVNEELDGVSLTGGPIASFVAGSIDTTTFSATYTIQDADGRVVNTATATGTPPPIGGVAQPPVTSEQSTTTTPVVRLVQDITVTKRAGVRLARRGDVVPYSIEVRNDGNARATIDVVDRLPVGFAYVPDTARMGRVEIDPIVSGRTLRFEAVTVPAKQSVVISLQARIGANVQPGDHVNVAEAVTPGTDTPIAPPGKATVRLQIEHVFDCGEIIGKVFDDRNRNGYQDEEVGEPGLPGVRLATVRGLLITTDRHGRFSVPCADIPDDQIGSNFILKLDTRTLPTGYRLTTENPRVVRLTKGKLTKLNFGAAIDKVVRIDLNASAFARGSNEVGPKLGEGLSALIPVLEREHSVVRLTYYAKAGEEAQARARLKAVAAQLRRQWKAAGGSYELGVETKIVGK